MKRASFSTLFIVCLILTYCTILNTSQIASLKELATRAVLGCYKLESENMPAEMNDFIKYVLYSSNQANCWNVLAEKVILKKVQALGDCVVSAVFLTEETVLYVDIKGIVSSRNIKEAQPILLLNLSTRVHTMILSEDKEHLLFSCENGYVRVYGLRDHKEVKCYKYPSSVHCAIFDSDNESIITGTADGKVRIFASDTTKFILDHSKMPVCSLKRQRGKDTLCSGARDKTIKLWNINTGQCLRTISEWSSPVYILGTIAFSSDGLYAIMGFIARQGCFVSLSTEEKPNILILKNIRSVMPWQADAPFLVGFNAPKESHLVRLSTNHTLESICSFKSDGVSPVVVVAMAPSHKSLLYADEQGNVTVSTLVPRMQILSCKQMQFILELIDFLENKIEKSLSQEKLQKVKELPDIIQETLFKRYKMTLQ